MSHFHMVQRIFAIEADRIQRAAQTYPACFRDGVAAVTFNDVYSADCRVGKPEEYLRFCDSMQKAGIPIQVNLSVTLGHGDGLYIADVPYPALVDYNGTRTRTGACPRSAAFSAHIQGLVRQYAAAHPTVFWLDDDFRLSFHAPAKYGCFCEKCIRRFNRENGLSLSREQLTEAIAQDARPQGKHIRRLWMQYNRSALVQLAGVAAEAAHRIDENIIIGFMQVNPDIVCYEMPDFRQWIHAAANKAGQVWFRHGALFYSDRQPLGVVEKNIAIARLCALTEQEGVVNLTEEVTAPYTRRGKSHRLTLLEAVMNIGVAGADGVMDEAIKPNLSEQLQPGCVVDWMHQAAPCLDKLHSLIQGKTQKGIYPYFSPDFWVMNPVRQTMEEMDDLGSRCWNELFYLGLPFTFREKGACLLLACGQTLRAMPDAQLRDWLHAGIYADGQSAVEIIRRFGVEAVGVQPDPDTTPLLDEVSERFTDHPLNGSAAGYCRHSIWQSGKQGNARLLPAGAELLSCGMSEATGHLTGMTIHRNPMGGQVAVTARGPWGEDVLSAAKAEQIQNVMNRLCGDGLPAMVQSRNRVGLSLWADEKEQIAFVYNTDFDQAEDIVLQLNENRSAALVCTGDNLHRPEQPLGNGNALRLPPLAPWSFAVVRLTKA